MYFTLVIETRGRTDAGYCMAEGPVIAMEQN
jgi:hypothetical protein